MKKLDEIFHTGEIQAQETFNKEKWPDSIIPGLNSMFREEFDNFMTSFVEKQHFFFIATANDKGECDCNFRGTETDNDGKLLPSALVTDSKTLMFPDYPGNNIYNSLGNIFTNPNIGMIFINFEKAIRIRVNGSAKIVNEHADCKKTWPEALRFIEVSVRQVYFNCPKRIKQSAGL